MSTLQTAANGKTMQFNDWMLSRKRTLIAIELYLWYRPGVKNTNKIKIKFVAGAIEEMNQVK